MALQRIVAIDCGAAHVAAGWFTAGTGGEIRLEAFAREDFTWDPTDESGWFSHVREALASLLMRHPCRGAKCCLSIPGHLVLTKVVKTPAVTRAHQARVIEFEASQNIPSPLEEVRWGCLKVADDGTDLELLLSAVNVPSGFYQPIFSVRDIAIKVTIWDGATLIMGGLTREEVKKVNDKVPVVGDIPMLGRLFKSKGESAQKRNLLIFVTANLLSPGGSPEKQNLRNVVPSSLFQNPVIVTPAGAEPRDGKEK
ncbi:MAG: hypothetical protein RIS54_2113 [Verrucomicrobiota bacterium]